MSFPRAKLHRFNDTQNYTPSPADYNVALKSHVAGAALSKTGRFPELRSPLSSDNGSFISNASVPTFRTPNPPRRMKAHHAASKPVELFQTADDIETLKEKIVEINNKDQYIQELTEQLEEMKQQLNEMELQIQVLKGDKSQLEEQLEAGNVGNNKTMQDLQAAHRLELSNMNERIVELSNKMKQMKKDYKELKEENAKDLTELLNNITKLEELNASVIDSYKTLINNKTKEVELKEDEVQQLKASCELKETEFRTLHKQFQQEKLSLQQDSEAKVKQLVENFKETSMLAEIQAKDKCMDIEMTWELKLKEAKDEADAILKECQAIAEYNIIQCEIEKNKAVYDLAEQKKDLELLQAENGRIKDECEDLGQKNKCLQSELSQVIVELNSVREKSAKELEEFKESTAKLTKDKYTYEITILKTHTTVEALKKRLMRSDSDVEQLKAELEATEVSRLEFEGKCNSLMDELQVVCGLCDDVEEQNELALRVAEEKVTRLEQELSKKVENYKQHASEQVANITTELNSTKEDLREVMEHLHHQQKLNNEAQLLIAKAQQENERLEQITSEYEIKIAYLEAAFDNTQTELSANHAKEAEMNATTVALKDENKKLRAMIDVVQGSNADFVRQVEELKEKCITYEKLNMQMRDRETEGEDFAKLREDYNVLSHKYDLLISTLETTQNDNSKLRIKIAEQESLIGPFREHLEAYEMEYGALMNQKKDAEKEAKEMGMKYAQILGHQNQKQKIKHLMDLKKKNYELSENKKELENKVRSQTRTIDKLKRELSTVTMSPKKLLVQAEEKENVSSPNRTLNSSRIESPGGPLRDRN